MKKIVMLFLALILMSTVACGISDPLAQGNRETEQTTATEKVTEEAKVYENSYDGLKKYMIDCGYINEKDSGEKMNAEFIGAKSGYRFIHNKITIELYEFETSKLSDKGKETVDAVKAKGSFKVFDKEIEAYLTSDEKFMMIYSNSDGNEEEHKSVIEAFNSFNK